MALAMKRAESGPAKFGPVLAGGKTMEIVLVTPKLAAEWLKRNTANYRKLRPKRVAEIGRAMVNGTWLFAADPIRFCSEGLLRDGQHRLTAVVETGVSVSMLVVTGLDAQATTVMDLGAKRSIQDQLSYLGYGVTTILSPATRWLVTWRSGGMVCEKPGSMPRLVSGMNGGEADEAIRRDPGIIEACADVAGDYKPPIIQKLGLVAFLLYAHRLIDRAKANEFWAAVATGENLAKGDPALMFRETVIKMSKPGKIYSREVYVAALAIKAFNAHMAGETVKFLRWPNKWGGHSERYPVLAEPDFGLAEAAS